MLAVDEAAVPAITKKTSKGSSSIYKYSFVIYIGED